ncbi:lipase family protein [Kibdelosporangium phytohabitans]|uniref:Lipase n=1 Tax=Kibdelosporangium phytohabitans TaxID=860235 RepID=A0A0N9I0V4_9PSEU|nr:lipase family protein [Kibdelosporangium phytohabitans]ALG11886.1 lipase [Kibdelosporangium phytohabitans]MBE1463326.1 putative esterase [Kibdelosporangium phytohabitans]
MRALSAILAALTMAVTVAAAPSAEAVDPGPADDSFYVPPAPLPPGAPGDVIRWRPAKIGPPKTPINETVTAYQVMYRSTDALGQPNAVTGTVVVPKRVDPAAAPIVGLAAGTHGPAFRCTPSKMIDAGAFYEQPAVNDMLTAGYAVAITDYEGYKPDPRTTYVVGQSMGHAVIDAVRAAQRLPETKLSKSAKVVFRGYSQGGGAALWAGEQQPAYAPDLDLVGVVGGGVPADLTQVALQLDGKRGFGLLMYSLSGLDTAYPDLKLDTYLNDAGRALLAEMRGDACTMELLLRYKDKKLIDYTTSSPVLTPPWLARVAENKLGGTPVAVPVLQYHATNDDLVDYSQAQALRDTYCSKGVKLTWRTQATDHITLVYQGNADAKAFIADRLAGKPATTTC